MQVQVKEATCQMTLLIRVDNALGGAQGKMQNNCIAKLSSAVNINADSTNFLKSEVFR